MAILWPFGRKKKITTPKRLDETGYSSLTKILIPVDQLTIGMYVAELDKPWVESSFLLQGFEIKTEKELRSVKDTCHHVYIDATRQRKNVVTPVSFKQIVAARSMEIAKYGTPPKKLGTFEKEISRAGKVYGNAESVVSNFMSAVENGGGIDSVLAKNAVAECVESVLHSPDTMLWLSQLSTKDEHTAQHSLNVSILSIVLGRHINLSNADLNNVGLCGMMHDIGKLLIPPEILHKSTPLDEEGLRIMRTHTRLGYKLLKSSENMSLSAAAVALTHHEQFRW